jgi:hypothetical protein
MSALGCKADTVIERREHESRLSYLLQSGLLEARLEQERRQRRFPDDFHKALIEKDGSIISRLITLEEAELLRYAYSVPCIASINQLLAQAMGDLADMFEGWAQSDLTDRINVACLLGWADGLRFLADAVGEAYTPPESGSGSTPSSLRRFVSNSAKTPSMSRNAFPAAVLVSIGCSVALRLDPSPSPPAQCPASRRCCAPGDRSGLPSARHPHAGNRARFATQPGRWSWCPLPFTERTRRLGCGARRMAVWIRNSPVLPPCHMTLVWRCPSESPTAPDIQIGLAFVLDARKFQNRSFSRLAGLAER